MSDLIGRVFTSVKELQPSPTSASRCFRSVRIHVRKGSKEQGSFLVVLFPSIDGPTCPLVLVVAGFAEILPSILS